MVLPLSHPHVLRFGSFEVDLVNRELKKGGMRLRLAEQPFQVLAMLLASAGQLVTREQIQQQLWRSNTFVDFEHGLNSAIRRLRSVLGDDASHPRFIETLPKRGYRFIGALERPSRTAPRFESRPAIAVLPLVDVSSSDRQAYFADGVTDQIITNLAKVSGLRVTSRTSVMRYRDTAPSIAEIGRELGVQAIVEGTIQRAGESILLTAKLIDVASDTTIWAEEYRRRIVDILDIQSELARSVAEQVQARLTSREDAQLVTHRAVRPDAYELYLQARYAAQQLTPESLRRAIELFRASLEIDPAFAPAWAGLADAFCWQPPVSFRGSESYGEARAAALKALEIDSANAQARKSLAWVRHAFDWDSAASDHDFRNTIDMAPSDSVTHAWYGIFLGHHGRFAESRQAMAEAQRLDPFSAYIRSMAEVPLLAAGDMVGFLAQVRKTLELDPNIGTTLNHLVRHHEEAGDFVRAITYRERHAIATGSPPSAAAERFSRWRSALTARGAEGYWRMLLDELDAGGAAEPFHVALAQAALGETELAFESLETAFRQRSPLLRFRLRWAPQFRPLRADARFGALLRRAGFDA